MTRESQIEKLKDVKEEVRKVEKELKEKIENEDHDKADIIQRQAIDKAKRDLKKAGSHIGYGNANRFIEEAKGRLEGIKATKDL